MYVINLAIHIFVLLYEAGLSRLFLISYISGSIGKKKHISISLFFSLSLLL